MGAPPTRAVILSEPPGHRLDRWVGERVMGHRGSGACPAYSTGLDAALLVAERSISNIELRRIRQPSGDWQWMAHLRFGEATGAAMGSDLPLAICRAALLSKLGL